METWELSLPTPQYQHSSYGTAGTSALILTFRHEIVANTEELFLHFSGEFLQFSVVILLGSS